MKKSFKQLFNRSAMFCCLVTALSMCHATQTNAAELRVTDYKKQTYTGFGGNLWWPVYMFNPNDTTRPAIYDRIFTDMNVSYLRMNLPDEFFPTAANASSTNPTHYNGNAFVSGRFQEAINNAKSRNSNVKIMFVPWTPPAYFKDNNSTSSGNFVSGTNNANETAYATQLAMWCKILKDTYNVQVDNIAVQNEPSYATSYQSCVFTKEQYRRVQEALRQKLTDLGVTGVTIQGPDDGASTTSSDEYTKYFEHVVNSASTDVSTLHIYHATADQALPGHLRRLKPLRQTEYSYDGNTDLGADQASEVARRFARDINEGDVVAWMWWNLAGNGTNTGGQLIQAGSSNWGFSGYFLTKSYYALKWISRYVDPGAVVRGATTDLSSVQVAGFHNSNNRYAAVITNTSASSQSFNLRFDELSGNRTFDCIRIDGSNDEAASTLSMSNGVISGTIGADTVLVLRDQNTAVAGNGPSVSSVSLLSQNKPVVASKAEGSNVATNAVDGNIDTKWHSDWQSGEYDTAWIYVDLGSTKTIKEVDLEWDWATGVDYVIQTAPDGATGLDTDTPWTTIKSVVGNTTKTYWLTYNNLTGTGRYVRVKGTRRTGAWGYELKEFQVYGLNGNTNTGDTNGPNLISNPSFDAEAFDTQTPSGWSEVQYDSNWANVTANASYSESYGGSASGTRHGTHWSNSAYRVYTYQTKTGLTNGSYTLQAKAKRGGTVNSCFLEAKDFGGTARTVNLPVSSAYQAIEIKDINVTNGQATIGIWSDASAGAWAYFDDVEFFKQDSTGTTATTGAALNRSGWVASVSGNSANASKALDGNASTRWDTAAMQTNGQWFQVDMGSSKTFNKIVLDATASSGDYPRGYQVYATDNTGSWGTAIASGSGSGAVTTITFPSTTKRYIRVVQTGSAGAAWWSIHEFNVHN